MTEEPTSGPPRQGLSERGWRTVSMAIWAGVVAIGVFALALIALGWRDVRLHEFGADLNLPELNLPHVDIPDVGTFRLEADAAEPAKPGEPPEGMAPADEIPDARPVDPDRLDG